MRLLRVIPAIFGFSNLAIAQLAPNVSAFDAAWETKLPKRPDTVSFKLEIDGETKTGDCKVNVDEGWTVYSHEADGGLEGTATNTYFRTVTVTGTAGMLCMNVAQKNYFAEYSISLKVQGGKIIGGATPTNCMIGTCPNKPLRVALASEDGKIIWTVDDSRKFELTKIQPK